MTETRRVVLLNDATNAKGGATGLAVSLAHGLVRQGLSVTYVAGDQGQPVSLPKEVTHVPLGGERLGSAMQNAALSALWNKTAHDRISNLIKETDQPGTVYHVHGWAQILSPAVFAALRPVAHRTIVHAHDYFLACPNGAYTIFPRREVCAHRPLGPKCLLTHCDKRSRAHKAWRVVRQTALRQSLGRGEWSAIAMIHPDMAGFLGRTRLPRERLVTVRNPAEAYVASRIPAERNQSFAYIGRLEREKGPVEFLAAARRANVPAIIVGDGPLLAKLKATYPEAEFAGWQDRAGIAAHVAKARAVVVPSHLPEPFGLVAAEASRSGLPVVVSDTALLSREIAAKGLGFAVNVHDAEAFAATIGRLRDMDTPEIQRMSEKGAQGGDGLSLTEAEWIDRLLGLYNAALAKAG